jgi:hypothetical protein
MCVKKGQSPYRAIFYMDRAIEGFITKKKRIGINLIPAAMSQ